MPQAMTYRWCFGLLSALCLLYAPGVTHATLMVTATVTPTAGVFHYDFTIDNNDPVDVTLVSIIDAPVDDPLIAPSLMFPAGFLASYDSGGGFVDFLGDTDLFASGTTHSGFRFTSNSGPSANLFSMFQFLTVNDGPFSGHIQTNVVPEPGTITLLLLGLGTLGALRGVRHYQRIKSTDLAYKEVFLCTPGDLFSHSPCCLRWAVPRG